VSSLVLGHNQNHRRESRRKAPTFSS